MSTKPAIPKGTRDFTPDHMMKRNYIFDTIKGVFQKYGYLPIETPAMENTATLLGKYGDEGDRLIFKILNRGATLDKALNRIKSNEENVPLAEQALRYDLTVPFARFVVQHQNEVAFPFKRYQIQPVWRADRPQKGRYREFYQCDVDVVGSDSLLNEVELIQVVDEVFSTFGIKTTIKLNNRKVLAGIAEAIGESDRMIDITVALDKLDKIGVDGVVKELLNKEFSEKTIDSLKPIIDFTGTNEEKINKLNQILSNIEIGQKGIEEIQSILDIVNRLGLTDTKLEIEITLARGLNYYTGAIFEVVCDEFPSSICGGGRYDDLTSIFGLKNVSGVGVSFGADRIYDLMLEQKLFPEAVNINLDVFILNFGKEEQVHCLNIASQLRESGVRTELYPDFAKKQKQVSKQLNYAKEKGAKKIVKVEREDIGKDYIRVVDTASNNEEKLSLQDLINSI